MGAQVSDYLDALFTFTPYILHFIMLFWLSTK
nr:MAG TPA: hypothetical protein [Caudoviricetes sp.]